MFLKINLSIKNVLKNKIIDKKSKKIEKK